MYKRIIAFIMVSVLAISLIACNKTQNNDTTTPSTTTEPTSTPTINENINLQDTEYGLLTLFEKCPTDFAVSTWTVDLKNKDILKQYVGLDKSTLIEEASVTEHAAKSKPYAIVLVKVKNAENAKAVASEMKNGVDLNRWDGEKVDAIETVVVGNYVLMAMMSSKLADVVTVQMVLDAFVEMMSATSS